MAPQNHPAIYLKGSRVVFISLFYWSGLDHRQPLSANFWQSGWFKDL